MTVDVNKVRADFPILERKINGYPLVYLDSAATSQKPNQVIEAVSDFYRRHNANIHRGVHTLSAEATQMVDEARKVIAQFIGAQNEEIVFVRNATEALNLVAYSWGEANIKKGEAIVVSLMEHHSNLVPWQRLCEKKGAELRIIDVDDEGKLQRQGERFKVKGKIKIGPLESLLDEKVKLVALTAVSNVLGTINDVGNIKDQIVSRAPQAKILVDAAQAVPHMKVNVDKWKVDFIVFSGHKMLGPTGVGVLWGSKEILGEMEPFLSGGDMIGEVGLEKTTWALPPQRFEAGTPDIAGIVGLAAAVKYLENLGMVEVREHEKELIDFGLRELEKLEKEGWVEIYGPREAENRGGVLTFNVKGVHAHDTATVLDNFGIAVRSGQHCGAPIVSRFKVPAMARASFYVYTTKEEIAMLVEKLREVKKIFA